MSDSAIDLESVNLASLNLVHDELLSTIDQSANLLEQFSADRNNGELLQECIEGVHQIRGILTLVQLTGADLLADELLALVNEITLGECETSDLRLASITGAYFLLPRYIEYTLQAGRGMPVLLLESINELRKARKVPPLPSSHYFSLGATASRPAKERQVSELEGAELAAQVRRFRHMYQLALLNVFKDKQVKPSLGMMQRALVRLGDTCAGKPMDTLWWIASVALSSMAEANMALTKPRKMLLGTVDRQIKQLQSNASAAVNDVDDVLLKELIHLVALSGSEQKDAVEVLSLFKAAKLGYDDAGLQREIESLKGPNADTLSAMSAVLRDELRDIKSVLERASVGGMILEGDTKELSSSLKKVAEILSIVGLVSAADSLTSEVSKVEAWADGDGTPVPQDMVDLADALLFVESSLSSVDKLNLSNEKLVEINSLSRDEVMSTSQLAEAENVVFTEAEAGLALVKRALSSFSESDFDRIHIDNVSSTLTAVRGGLSVLNLPRAANILVASVEFIEECLLHNDQPAALQQLLETFADAVISLEYYLDAVKTDRSTDDTVLEIAEESLEALGFSVAA